GRQGRKSVTDVEIGRGKTGRRAYSLAEIGIVPARRTRDPEEVSIAWQIDAYRFELPLMACPMDSVVSPATAIQIGRLGARAEPLNLKQFIYELDVPVVVGGCATYTAALHLMRTGAAGVLVGFGGGSGHTTVKVLGVAVPMATAIADVAAARRDYLDESGGRYVHV